MRTVFITALLTLLVVGLFLIGFGVKFPGESQANGADSEDLQALKSDVAELKTKCKQIDPDILDGVKKDISKLSAVSKKRLDDPEELKKSVAELTRRVNLLHLVVEKNRTDVAELETKFRQIDPSILDGVKKDISKLSADSKKRFDDLEEKFKTLDLEAVKKIQADVKNIKDLQSQAGMDLLKVQKKSEEELKKVKEELQKQLDKKQDKPGG